MLTPLQSTNAATHIHNITEREIIVSSNIHFAMGGAIFGDFTTESIKLIAKYGLPGVEPYRGHLTAWLDKPQALKEILDLDDNTVAKASENLTTVLEKSRKL